jgi:hypothetical protein
MNEKIPDSVYASDVLNEYREKRLEDEVSKSPWREVVKEE